MSEIQIFNKAFRVAWDLAAEHAAMKSGFGAKLNDALKKLMKEGGSPEEIGKAAFEKVCPNLLSFSEVA